MHIAINISPLKGGHTNRGVGVYTKNLIEALKRYESRHTYHLFDSQKEIPIEADVIHYPFFDPFFLTLPFFSPKPTVVTVHDLIPIVYPKHFPKGLRGSIKWAIQKLSLQRKQRIITDSECSKKDITRITSFPEDKVDVVYLASSLQKTTVSKNSDSVKKCYGMKGDYFLYVGDVNWNKNIVGLLKAFAMYIKDHTSFTNLVFVGKVFLDETLTETKKINALCKDLKIEGNVTKTGYVSDDHLAELYNQATALIQPSFYEGFGFPVLDALSCGCPVVSSSASSLKEIAGPSIMVDPNNPISIASGMKAISSLTWLKRKELILNGIEWVNRFTWQKVARETIRSYEKVLEHI